MRRIAICVCTLDQPAGLRALLGAINRQRFSKLEDAQILTIVVDNSATGSAAETVRTHAAQARFQTTVVPEPRKGLSYARNTALQAAHEADAFYLAFVDDDELPTPSWLEALVDGLDRSGAAAGVGPVWPLFEKPPGNWLPPSKFGVWRNARDGFAVDGYTGNVLLRLSAIEACGLRFDLRFNETGGEDVYFFKQARDKGLQIAWIENAVVHTVIPVRRMSVGWLCRRWYRTGTTEAYLGRFDPATAAGRAHSLLRGTARLLVGCARVVVASALHFPRRPDAIVSNLFTLCRGAGLIANALGQEYREYSKPNYR